MKFKILVTILVVLTFTLTALTFVPILARHNRIDAYRYRVDMLYHTHAEDYLDYLSLITRGQAGLLWNRDPFIAIDHSKKPLLLLYPIMGLLSIPFHLPSSVVYHIGRLLCIAAAVWALYVLAKVVLKNKTWAAVATIIAIIAPNPPNALYRQDVIATFIAWWEELSPFGKINDLPHHLAEQAFLCLAIAALIQHSETKRRKYLLISSISATLAIFMVPQVALIYGLLVGVYGIAKTVSLLRSRARHEYVTLGMIASVMILPMIALGWIWSSTRNPVWVACAKWEMDFWHRDPWVYYHLLVSSVFLLVPAYGGFVAKFKRSVPVVLLGVWAILPFLAAPILPLFATASGRFIMTNHIYIPLAILATIAVRMAIQKPIGIYLVVVWLVIMGFFACTNMYVTLTYSWKYISHEPLLPFYYPPKNYIDSAKWMSAHVPPETTILAGPQLGSLIAAYAPVFVYMGENTHGANWDLITDNHVRFYSGEMNENEARQWIVSHDVTWVVLDPTFFVNPPDTLPYTFLTPVWHELDITIYKVK